MLRLQGRQTYPGNWWTQSHIHTVVAARPMAWRSPVSCSNASCGRLAASRASSQGCITFTSQQHMHCGGALVRRLAYCVTSWQVQVASRLRGFCGGYPRAVLAGCSRGSGIRSGWRRPHRGWHRTAESALSKYAGTERTDGTLQRAEWPGALRLLACSPLRFRRGRSGRTGRCSRARGGYPEAL